MQLYLVFLQKMVKKLYNSKGGREIGSLANYKIMLKRTNVNGQVKGRYQSHEDFVQTVGTGLILGLALDKLGMDKLNSSPVHHAIPENIARMHVKNRETIFHAVMQDIIKDILLPFDLSSAKPISFELHVPGQGITEVKVDSQLLDTRGELTIRVPGVTGSIKLLSDATDELRNYSLQVLQWFMVIREFSDAIKEGDPFRSNICLKQMLPFFYGYSARSKYFVECVDYILKTEVLLPPALAMRCRLGSFVNTLGGHKNKPADMQQENNILVLKDVIKGLGAGKTEKAMMRATEAAPVANEIVEKYKTVLGISSSDGKHKRKSDEEDVQTVLNFALEQSLFKPNHRRKMKHFSGIRSNFYSKVDKILFAKHLSSVANRLKRGGTTDDLVDEED